MNIGITTFGCDLQSGMSRYVSNLVRQFSVVGSEHNFDVLAHRSALGEYNWRNKGRNFDASYVPEWLAQPVLNVAWHQGTLPAIALRKRFDALFLPAASRRTPVWVPCPTIGTVHDLGSFHISCKYDPIRTLYQKQILPVLLRRLTHIIAISESTKRDIQSYVGIADEDITVIYHGVDTTSFFPHDKQESAAAVHRYGIRAPYVIYTSRIESPGKNHLRLIQAFETLKAKEKIEHQLVLAGADWHGAEIVHAAAQASPFAKDIVMTGFVPSGDLPKLYCGADMMIFPSLFEGFGFPILEAMACGVPVACSNVGSMPEIAGGAAALFDPLDADSIAATMGEVLASDDETARLSRLGPERSREFTWEKTARLTLDTIRRVAGR